MKHNLVVEVKTTDAYRIDLNTIANYRIALAKSGEIEFEKSSVLIIVGRDELSALGNAMIRLPSSAFAKGVFSWRFSGLFTNV